MPNLRGYIKTHARHQKELDIGIGIREVMHMLLPRTAIQGCLTANERSATLISNVLVSRNRVTPTMGLNGWTLYAA